MNLSVVQILRDGEVVGQGNFLRLRMELNENLRDICRRNEWAYDHPAIFFTQSNKFFLNFRVFNVPSVARNCSIVPQQDLSYGASRVGCKT